MLFPTPQGLCSCDAESLPASEIGWELKCRDETLPRNKKMGKCRGPDPLKEDDVKTHEHIVKEMNDRNCFDFDLDPQHMYWARIRVPGSTRGSTRGKEGWFDFIREPHGGWRFTIEVRKSAYWRVQMVDVPGHALGTMEVGPQKPTKAAIKATGDNRVGLVGGGDGGEGKGADGGCEGGGGSPGAAGKGGEGGEGGKGGKGGPPEPVGLGFCSEPIEGVDAGALWESMLLKIAAPELFLPVKDVECRVTAAAATWRTMTFDGPGPMHGRVIVENIYSDEASGEILFVALNEAGEETDAAVVVNALLKDPLRIEYYQRHGETKDRMHWAAPKVAATAGIAKTVELSATGEGGGADGGCEGGEGGEGGGGDF